MGIGSLISLAILELNISNSGNTLMERLQMVYYFAVSFILLSASFTMRYGDPLNMLYFKE